MPSHFYDAVDGQFEVFYSQAWIIVPKNEMKVRRIPNKDLILFSMPVQFHEHKGVAKHLVSEKQLNTVLNSEALLVRQMTKDQVTLETVQAKAFKELHYELDGEVPKPYYVMGLWQYRSAASPGACGSVLMTTDDRVEGQILGFHCAGDGTYGYAQILTREMVDGFMTTQLGTPAPECTQHFSRIVPPGHFGRVGSLPKGQGIRQSDKTEIIPTKIHGMISTAVTEPAVLSRRDVRYVGNEDIMTKGIGKYGKPALPFDPRHIKMIEESINAEIETWRIPRTPEILTMEQTLQGLEMIDGMDRLPMNTSPGWPYTKTRPTTELGKAYLFDAEQKRITDKDLERNWDARLALAKRGERVQSVWTCCLKDERRPLAKIASGSTRLFVIPPVDFSLLMRMYTLDFSVAIKMNRHESFTKVGIDTQSFEWTQLYNYLASCSEFVVAGDFARFDGTLPPELTHQFFEHCNFYYSTHGACTEEDRTVRRVLADESVHTVLLAKEEIFVTHVGNKSGNPNTVNINSFANYYYMALSYLGLAERYCPEQATMDKFRKNVKLAIYGDDNVLAIKKEILEWYNQLTIADFLDDFGIEYTNETKTGLTKYKKLDDASFLKCRFANHESIAKVKVPHMTEATILELLNWTRKAPDQDELLESNCNDALRFAYFYGAKYFNELRAKIVRSLKSVNLTLDIMTYSDFHYWFLFVCGMLPCAKFKPEMNVLEAVAARGNSSFARFLTRAFVGVPCGIFTSLGWFVRSSEKERTDKRFAIAIPSGEGKSWLCKRYPNIFVDHDEILLPAAKQALKKHGMSWSRLWEILEIDTPVEDQRILLVHHPANTRRQMLGSYVLPQPCHIRANAYQRMRLGQDVKVMERDERNSELLTLAKRTAPHLFGGDE
uniref:RNA-directed RNA polymerase n=1 Tax=Crocidura lasiura ribovirus 12 TaxID=3139490 RepID=A0AB38ZJZ4_9VIRU